MSSVLVTGGSGFVGSHVVDRLLAEGHDVRNLDVRQSPYVNRKQVPTIIGDVGDIDAVRKALRGCDTVIHLAAAADVGEVAQDPAGAERVNARGTLAVLQAARDEGVKRVVYASTVWVYSDVEQRSVDEDTPLRPPAHLYSATKLAGELYCRSYEELYGMECTILRFGIPYGPRARPAAVLPSFVNRALAGEPLTIAGAGDQTRRFVYVEDLAEGVVCALAPCAARRTYNLVSETDVSIREVATAVQRAVGDVQIVHTEGRNGDFGGVEVSGERAATELGWRPRTPFHEGVRRYVEWHRAELAKPARADPRPSARRLVRGLGAPVRLATAFVIGVMVLIGAQSITPSELAHDLFGVISVLALMSGGIVAAGDRRPNVPVWLASGMVFGWFVVDVPDEMHAKGTHFAWLMLGVVAMVVANLVARRAARALERESA